MKRSVKPAVVLFLTAFSLAVFPLAATGLSQNSPPPNAPRTNAPRTNAPQLSSSRQSAIRFVPGANRSAPRTGRSRGGASRGNCPETSQTLMALVPAGNANQQAVPPDLTVSDRPTFWFYVPYSLSAERPAEFALLDEMGEYVYQTRITSETASGGILRIQIPEDIPALEAGKTYSWTFQVLCEGSNPIDLWGSLERIALNSNQQTRLQQLSTPADRAAFYAENGIWYDALGIVADLYHADRTDPVRAANWESLLRSVGLASVAAERLLNSYPRL
ncbi:DUF928 domain-containing protein [Leptolyngbya ohadii]|uniref:DUF928 domain-containing protein n=1 Tax=Leptolyngbya ohadii TaxID=1962290 RepID=UPI0015C684FC|nr:DUF928 domain-containing protein [Leptolyngbya ohadii]